MRTLFLSSSGLNEKTTKLFWECIGKEPQNTKVIFVPSAAGNFADGLGYLTNPLIPHAEIGNPCGEISNNDSIELSDGQIVLIQGEHREIIC